MGCASLEAERATGRRMEGLHEARRRLSRTPILSVNNIEVIYDHVILVLKGVSLTVPKGGITALLGANGAGKTTTLKAISNLLRSRARRGDQGHDRLRGRSEVQALSPNDLVRRGCIQVMEGRHCFGHLSVEDNLIAGAFTRRDGKAAIRRDLDLVYDYFPRLKVRRTSQAGYTSGGEQQMTAIGRALMSRPKMILLDEPSMGLAPQLVEEIFEHRAASSTRSRACPSCLPSRTPTSRSRFAKYGYILESGRVVLDGEASALRENEDVKEFYLGDRRRRAASRSRTSSTTSGASAGWLEGVAAARRLLRQHLNRRQAKRDNPAHCPWRGFSLCALRRSPEGFTMADHSPTGPGRNGREDGLSRAREHLYAFISLAKYGSLVCCRAARRHGVRLLHQRRLLLGDGALLRRSSPSAATCCATCRRISPDTSDLTSSSAAAAPSAPESEFQPKGSGAVGQIIFIPREIEPNEPRVAASPDTVKRLVGLGFDVVVEAGAGLGSRITDEDFAKAGAIVGKASRCRRGPTSC